MFKRGRKKIQKRTSHPCATMTGLPAIVLSMLVWFLDSLS